MLKKYRYWLYLLLAMFIGLVFTMDFTLIRTVLNLDDVSDRVTVVEGNTVTNEKAIVSLTEASHKARAVLKTLQDQSVLVDTSFGKQRGCGSGVIVTRQVGEVRKTFVWTAGHVAKSLRDSEGTFRNATIRQEWRADGQFRCKSDVQAKVIAYSDPLYGEDLALLEVLQDNFSPLSVSATFVLSDYIPPVGTELIHVGSTLGIYNSLSRGLVAQTDRDLLKNGKTFDQTSCVAYPGCSGGGAYLASDGRCIGLVVLSAGPGLNFVVPARRMLAWAKTMRVEWAMNPSVPLPVHWNMREATPLTDGSELGETKAALDALLKTINDAIQRALEKASPRPKS